MPSGTYFLYAAAHRLPRRSSHRRRGRNSHHGTIVAVCRGTSRRLFAILGEYLARDEARKTASCRDVERLGRLQLAILIPAERCPRLFPEQFDNTAGNLNLCTRFRPPPFDGDLTYYGPDALRTMRVPTGEYAVRNLYQITLCFIQNEDGPTRLSTRSCWPLSLCASPR